MLINPHHMHETKENSQNGCCHLCVYFMPNDPHQKSKAPVSQLMDEEHYNTLYFILLNKTDEQESSFVICGSTPL